MEPIIIKKVIEGINAETVAFEDFFVQLTVTDEGATLSVEEYTIPLNELGIQVRTDFVGRGREYDSNL